MPGPSIDLTPAACLGRISEGIRMSALKDVLAGMAHFRYGRTVFCLAPMALLLVACGQQSGQAGAAAGGGMPPATVGVVTVAPSTVSLMTELPGRLEASRVAQVRARAAGILRERLFKEGSDVKAGQPLFRIDPAPYQAAYASAQASLARAQANATQAEAQAERYKPLMEANAISKQDYINAVAAQKTAEADVAAGRAALQTAQINLGYASVTSPIAGRIGRALVTEGALVGQGEVTELAVVQQINPMYVNFTQSTTEVLRLRKALASGQLQKAGADAAKVHVVLEDGTEYAQPGRLLFSDLTVDPTSGQITLRAELPNPTGLLLPGMYVRVRLAQAQLPSGILLPQQAVTRSDKGDTVLVVGTDNKPAPRPIKVGSAQGNQWLVTEGLQPGEKVIVDGFQKMMVPGAPVNPVPWSPTNAASAAAPASSPASTPALASPASAASARQ
jgi:membrane fusion protein (multidrug efflux system)